MIRQTAKRKKRRSYVSYNTFRRVDEALKPPFLQTDTVFSLLFSFSHFQPVQPTPPCPAVAAPDLVSYTDGLVIGFETAA